MTAGLRQVNEFTVQVQIAQHLFTGNAARLIDHGQATARMRAASDQVHALQIFKAIVWSQVQHLVQAVGQIEGGSAIDGVFILPIGRRDHPLTDNAFLDIVQADLLELLQVRVLNACRVAASH